MAETITQFQTGADISNRVLFQRVSVFVRKVTIRVSRVSWKAVGYESYATAKTAADTKAGIAGNSDVRVIPIAGGLHNVTWTTTTETPSYGPWYIPSPFDPA